MPSGAAGAGDRDETAGTLNDASTGNVDADVVIVSGAAGAGQRDGAGRALDSAKAVNPNTGNKIFRGIRMPLAGNTDGPCPRVDGGRPDGTSDTHLSDLQSAERADVDGDRAAVRQ